MSQRLALISICVVSMLAIGSAETPVGSKVRRAFHNNTTTAKKTSKVKQVIHFSAAGGGCSDCGAGGCGGGGCSPVSLGGGCGAGCGCSQGTCQQLAYPRCFKFKGPCCGGGQGPGCKTIFHEMAADLGKLFGGGGCGGGCGGGGLFGGCGGGCSGGSTDSCSGCSAGEPGCGISDVGCSCGEPGCGIADAGCSCGEPGCGIADASCGAPMVSEPGCGIADAGCSCGEPGCGIADVSCGAPMACEPGCGIADAGCSCGEPGCGIADVSCGAPMACEPECGIAEVPCEPECGIAEVPCEPECGIAEVPCEPECGIADPGCGCSGGGTPGCGCAGGNCFQSHMAGMLGGGCSGCGGGSCGGCGGGFAGLGILGSRSSGGCRGGGLFGGCGSCGRRGNLTTALFGPCVGGCCCAPYTCQTDGLESLRLFSQNKQRDLNVPRYVSNGRSLKYTVSTNPGTGEPVYVATKPQPRIATVAATAPLPSGVSSKQVQKVNHYQNVVRPQVRRAPAKQPAVRRTTRKVGPKSASTRVRRVSHEAPVNSTESRRDTLIQFGE